MSKLASLQGRIGLYSLWISLLSAVFVTLAGYVAIQLQIPKGLLIFSAMVIMVWVGFVILLLARRISEILDKIEKL